MKKYRITQKEYVIKLADGSDYKIKPLTLAESKEMSGLIKEVGKYDSSMDLQEAPELMDRLISVVAKILIRTNPGLKEERIGEIVTVKDIQPILTAAFGGVPEDTEEVK